MRLLKRIFDEKRFWVVPLAVAVAIDVIMYTAAVYPLTVRVAGAERRARAAADSLDQADRAHATARATLAAKSRADADLQTFYHDVLPHDLAGARRITYARLAALAESARLRHERRSSSTDRARDSRLGRLQTTMVLAGDYASIRQFLYALETTPEFVVIDDVTLVQREAETAPLVLTIEVSTYYWTGSEDA